MLGRQKLALLGEEGGEIPWVNLFPPDPERRNLWCEMQHFARVGLPTPGGQTCTSRFLKVTSLLFLKILKLHELLDSSRVSW